MQGLSRSAIGISTSITVPEINASPRTPLFTRFWPFLGPFRVKKGVKGVSDCKYYFLGRFGAKIATFHNSVIFPIIAIFGIFLQFFDHFSSIYFHRPSFRTLYCPEKCPEVKFLSFPIDGIELPTFYNLDFFPTVAGSLKEKVQTYIQINILILLINRN